MKVLIGFVSKSDPWPEGKQSEGPAQIVTAAKALTPDAIYLLHTASTINNARQTKEFLAKELPSSKIDNSKDFFLELPDPTDYQQLKVLFPAILKKISRLHPGSNFYLISGLAQARFIFALCLNSLVLNGELIETNRPDKNCPWPDKKDDYFKRLEVLDLEFFSYFRDLFIEKYQLTRLKINLNDEEVLLDGKRFDFRKRYIENRSFLILVLLSALMRYGDKNAALTKNMIAKHVYKNEGAYDVNIPRIINSINKQAAKFTAKSPNRIDKMIITPQPGSYCLNEALSPYEETITFIGDLKAYLTSKVNIKEWLGLLPFLA